MGTDKINVEDYIYKYKFASDYPDPRVQKAFEGYAHNSIEANNYALMLAVQDLTAKLDPIISLLINNEMRIKEQQK